MPHLTWLDCESPKGSHGWDVAWRRINPGNFFSWVSKTYSWIINNQEKKSVQLRKLSYCFVPKSSAVYWSSGPLESLQHSTHLFLSVILLSLANHTERSRLPKLLVLLFSDYSFCTIPQTFNSQLWSTPWLIYCRSQPSLCHWQTLLISAQDFKRLSHINQFCYPPNS